MTTQDDQPRRDPRADHPQDRPTAPDAAPAPGAGSAPARDGAPHDAPPGSTPAPATPATGGFNLSDWALHHRSLVWFLLIVSMVAGLISYRGLGREEDPNFTIKVMVISAAMPGATIAETLDQVTDRIETKLDRLTGN